MNSCVRHSNTRKVLTRVRHTTGERISYQPVSLDWRKHPILPWVDVTKNKHACIIASLNVFC